MFGICGIAFWSVERDMVLHAKPDLWAGVVKRWLGLRLAVFGALLVAALAAADGVRWSVELCGSGCVPSAGVLGFTHFARKKANFCVLSKILVVFCVLPIFG
jgi:hypothetical protein